MIPKKQQEQQQEGDLQNGFEGAWSVAVRPRRRIARLRSSEAFGNARTESSRRHVSHDTVISVALIDEKPFTRECIAKSLQALDERLRIISFGSCEDYLRSTRSQDLILYYAHQHLASWSGLYNQLLKLLRIVPVIILSDVDCLDSMLAIFESGARGFITTDQTTLEQIIEIIGLVKAGGIFVPPSSLALRKVERQFVRTGTDSRQLSRSEIAVLDCLKLGKANKIIAHELGMSESTVKMYIGRIMKKLKATNRTEVVCRAYGMAAGGLRLEAPGPRTGRPPEDT
jgi:DNA-binding NarL/FixJ family response regulator